MDKSRQQFEEVFIEQIPNHSNSVMHNALKESFWIFWQASRESLINSLEPVGYINPVGQLCIKRKLNAAIKQNKEDNSIPLYRLDK